MTVAARSESRSGTKVRVLAVHTSEGEGTAQALRDAAWWTGSSHAIADDAGTLLTPAEGMVAYDRAAWTLRSGNPWSENIELIGMAAWTRGIWLTKTKLLDACARWLADRSKARGIPLVKLTPAEYRAGKSGVIGHNDHTVGYKDGTHWDPGPDFPWDVVLAKATALRDANKPATEDDMPLNDADLAKIRAIVDSAVANRELGTVDGNKVYWWQVAFGQIRDSKVLAALDAKLDRVLAALPKSD